VVNISVNNLWKQAIPYIYTNGQWKQVMPYIYNNEGWSIVGGEQPSS
jgi:hypothetical protein